MKRRSRYKFRPYSPERRDWQEAPKDWSNGEKVLCAVLPAGAILVTLVMLVLRWLREL